MYRSSHCSVIALATAATILAGCRASPQAAFWERLSALCNHAYEGRVTESSVPDSTFSTNRLVIYVRNCTDSVIEIPLHVGEDRSRIWILTRTPQGLRLKHEHVDRDGQGDGEAITNYGGETATVGEPGRQDFRADVATARMLPAAARNVWTIEIIPGERFAYSLQREGTDRRIRIEFDLTRVLEGGGTEAPRH